MPCDCKVGHMPCLPGLWSYKELEAQQVHLAKVMLCLLKFAMHIFASLNLSMHEKHPKHYKHSYKLTVQEN